jgi:predicted secreted protein with PEFG-CTERM motif
MVFIVKSFSFLIIAIFAGFLIPPVFAESITVTTDKTQLTEPYQKFIIQGTVVSDPNPRLVIIQIFDPNGKLVYSPSVLVDKGKFLNVAKVESSWTTNGIYTIEASAKNIAQKAQTQVTLQKGGAAAPTQPATSSLLVSGLNVEYSKNVKIASSSVDPEQKTVTFTLSGTFNAGTVMLKLPQELIFNPNSVWVDGTQIEAFEIVKSGAANQITIPISSNSKEIVIMGASVIPEFGSIAVIILTISIIMTIVGLRTKNLLIRH